MGQVVGWAETAAGFGNAFLYSGGAMANLGTVSGFYESYAYSINNFGDIVGELDPWFAMLYHDGQMVSLGTLPGFEAGYANAINNLGQIAGTATNSAGSPWWHGFIIENGVMVDLGTLPGGESSHGSQACGINDSGQVVGFSYINGEYTHAFIYSNGQMTDLGVPPGGADSYGYAINNSGQVVGAFDLDPSSNNSYAFFYSNGVMSDLNPLIPANSGWQLYRAEAINNKGQIVGYGYINGMQHAYLLTPVAVYAQVKAAFTTDISSGIIPFTVTFTDQTTGDFNQEVWDFGDGTSATNPGTSFTKTFTTAGNLTVTLTASGSGGTSTATAQITGYAPTVAAFSASPLTGVVPLSVTFTDQTAQPETSRTWSFGDGSPTSTASPITHTYTNPGTYTATLSVNGQGGPSTKTATINVYTQVNAEFTTDVSSGIVPFAVRFTDNTTGSNQEVWNFGDGTSLTNPGTNFTKTFTAAGNFTVTLTASGPGGTSTATAQITGYAPTVVAFSASPLTGVAPLSVTFTDQTAQPETGWTWNFGDGSPTVSGTKSPTHQYNNPGIYNVALTAVGPGGTNTATQTVTATLNNPQNVSATLNGSWVALTWSPIVSQFLDHYAVYMVDGSNFTSVAGMSPVKTCTTAGANMTGLQTGHTYYFAVTAVTASGCEKKDVGTVYANIVVNKTGPVITNVQMNGAPLVSGATVTQSPLYTLTATDPAGMARVEFAFDGNLYSTDSNGSSQYSCQWNVSSVAGGNHSLAITAYDTIGNKTSVSYTLAVEQSPPPAPVIKQPASGASVNSASITVQGSAQCNSQVMLYNNGSQAGSWTPVDSNCNFSLPLSLSAGTNNIQAAAQNLKGVGPLCFPVTVTFNTNKPRAPTGLSAMSQPGGAIALGWTSTGTAIQGFNLYRASAPFSSPAGASKLNGSPIPATSYTDLPATDGTYYYAVSAVDQANNESGLSANASAVSDRVPPVAKIAYSPQGTVGPGVVSVTLTVSKPLSSIPFLSITPNNGVPIPVDLTMVSNLEYYGLFVISNTTPSGTANAVFSARDLAGNRGTEIDAGATILIDTTGPAISQLTIVPDQPIKNNSSSPVTVQVTFGLTKAVAPGSAPTLNYNLSDYTGVTTLKLSQISPPAGQVQAWQGSFTLLPSDGVKDVETLTFSYSGTDYLGNVSTQILCNSRFQVYQGNLPPLAAPSGLTGQALPGGKVQLNWSAVQGAAGYQLYRQAPGESSLTPYQQQLGAVLQYTDSTSVDGQYTYAVASVRQANGQVTVSGQSAPVTVTAISTPPPAPTLLTLTLTAQGIQALWNQVVDSNPVTYSLYRDNVTPIQSMQGLTPVASRILPAAGSPPSAPIQAYDSTPSTTMHYYAVTAVDVAGNESPPSNTLFLDFKLVPVSNLSVALNQGSPPVVSWNYPQQSGYTFNVLAGSPQAGTVQLNSAPLTALSIVDTGYTGGDRTYTVTAVDSDQVASIPCAITLPALNAVIKDGSLIRRGVMNSLVYVVTSQSSSPVDNIRIGASVAGNTGINHQCPLSGVFSIDPGQSIEVPVTVGGYADLPDEATVSTVITTTPNAGESVQISPPSSQVNVGNGMLLLGILNQQFTRGGTGQVQFTLQNTGDDEIEIKTMSGSNQSSSDVTFSLLDQDGNVLSSTNYTQNLGQYNQTLPNLDSVAIIAPGQTFTSNLVTMTVPSSAPGQVTIQLQIANLYGQLEQVSINGISTRRQISLVDTAYYGQVISVTPPVSNGNQNIVISGDAIARSTGLPLPNVPLNLVISVNGFQRTFPVLYRFHRTVLLYVHAGCAGIRHLPGMGKSSVYTG